MNKLNDIFNLSDIYFEQTFCDSFQALNIAFKKGLNKSTHVLTSSPWILTTQKKNIKHLENNIVGEKLKKLQKSIYPFTLSIFDALTNRGFKNERLISSQNGFYFQRLLRKAACLKNEDKYKSSLILKVDTGNNEMNNNINTQWEKLFFTDNFKFKTLKFEHPYQKKFKERNYTYFDLINLYSFQNLYYFFCKKFNLFFNFNKSKEQVIIFREDNLTREICFHLIKKGIEPIFFKDQSIKKNDFSKERFLKIREILEPLIINYSKRWVCANFLNEVVNNFFLDLKKNLDLKNSYKFFFKQYISSFKKKILCISSYPALPKLMGLAETLEQNKIKFIATQHGINREINETYTEGITTMENGVSDVLFVNNLESKKVSDKSPFMKGISYVVGTPKQISIKKKFKLWPFNKKIFYISTRISAGNLNMLNGYLTDYERVNQELQLIKKALGKVSKEIIYKAYPTLDYYIDEDPVHFAVSKLKNMRLLKTPKDNQFFFSGMKLIITTRATSTLASCLLSSVPIIFINYPDQYMVKKEIINLLKKSIIFFDATKKNFYKKLIDKIESPIESIIDEWKLKKKSRENFINEYISTSVRKDAGEVAVDYLFKHQLFKRTTI